MHLAFLACKAGCSISQFPFFYCKWWWKAVCWGCALGKIWRCENHANINWMPTRVWLAIFLKDTGSYIHTCRTQSVTSEGTVKCLTHSLSFNLRVVGLKQPLKSSTARRSLKLWGRSWDGPCSPSTGLTVCMAFWFVRIQRTGSVEGFIAGNNWYDTPTLNILCPLVPHKVPESS